MFKPPLDSRDYILIEEPTWRSVTVSYAMAAALPLLVWIISKPRARTVILAAIWGLFVGGRRAYRLTRRFYNGERFTFNLRGKVRITVTQIPTDDAN